MCSSIPYPTILNVHIFDTDGTKRSIKQNRLHLGWWLTSKSKGRVHDEFIIALRGFSYRVDDGGPDLGLFSSLATQGIFSGETREEYTSAQLLEPCSLDALSFFLYYTTPFVSRPLWCLLLPTLFNFLCLTRLVVSCLPLLRLKWEVKSTWQNCCHGSLTQVKQSKATLVCSTTFFLRIFKSDC